MKGHITISLADARVLQEALQKRIAYWSGSCWVPGKEAEGERQLAYRDELKRVGYRLEDALREAEEGPLFAATANHEASQPASEGGAA